MPLQPPEALPKRHRTRSEAWLKEHTPDVLNHLILETQSLEAESTQERLDLAPLDFWKHISTLHTAGLVVTAEKLIAGERQTVLIPTEKGRMLLSQTQAIPFDNDN